MSTYWQNALSDITYVLMVLEPVLIQIILFRILYKLTKFSELTVYSVCVLLNIVLLYIHAYIMCVTDDNEAITGFSGIIAAIVWSPTLFIIVIVWLVMAVKAFRRFMKSCKKTTNQQEE